MELFRSQVIDHQSRRLYGHVALTTPLSTRLISALIGVIVAGLLVAVFTGNYARQEKVTGWLKPDKGLIKLVASQLGTVEKVHVESGQVVKAGDPLVTLDFDIVLSGGSGVVQSAVLEMDEQIAQLESLLRLTEAKYDQEVAMVEGHLLSARMGLPLLENQLAIVDDRIGKANRVLRMYEDASRKGAASALELENRRSNVLALQQSRSGIELDIQTKNSQIENYSKQLSSIPVQRQTELADVLGRLSGLRAQKVQLARGGSVVMAAPVTGRIASLPISDGQSIRPQQLAISILPIDGRLEAELYVPTRAVGFVKKGQDVRLKFDAFPAQKFGVTHGQIISVSKTIFEPSELPPTLGLTESAYRILVALDQQQVRAHGDYYPLQSGMTLTAHIVQEDRKLWEVILDPLLSRV